MKSSMSGPGAGFLVAAAIVMIVPAWGIWPFFVGLFIAYSAFNGALGKLPWFGRWGALLVIASTIRFIIVALFSHQVASIIGTIAGPANRAAQTLDQFVQETIIKGVFG